MTRNFTLTIDISPDGQTVEGTITGIQGRACSNIAALLDKVGRETAHHYTEDYHKTELVRAKSSKTKVRSW